MNDPYRKWFRYTSTEDMETHFRQDRPTIGGLDTEGDGLHIIKNKPFLIVFGWLIPNTDKGRVYSFKPTTKNNSFLELAQKLDHFFMWNAKFDLHMLKNIGLHYEYRNVAEGMALARLTMESLSSREGGREFSLSLKNIGKTYVSTLADRSEKIIKKYMMQINQERLKMLSAALKQFPTGEKDKRGKPKYWNKGMIEDFLKDITHDVDDLPEGVRDVFKQWKKDHPPATYYDVYKRYPNELIEYAQDDVITMLEFVKKALPILKKKKQEKIFQRENQLIFPLMRMERVGLKVNQTYLEKSRKKLKNEILRKRKEMQKIAGEPLKIGQHQRIKEIYRNKWSINMLSSDKKALKDIVRNQTGEPKRLAELIMDLRRLEKWYATYCLRIIDSLHKGRFYTTFHQCGTVSGRLSSDSQQFPKERILTDEGNKYEEIHGKGTAPEEFELFYPRKAFEPTDRDRLFGYNSIYYLDFSQIELRNQAEYTIRTSGGDLNLCRAYMPFKCRDKNGRLYNFLDPEKRREWNTKNWYDEHGNPWVKTDVHSETTHNALMILGYECVEKYKTYNSTKDMPEENKWVGNRVDEDSFQKARHKGKTFNFMANYGGGLRAAMEQLDLPKVVAMALLQGYEEAFPEVVVFREKVQQRYDERGYVQNMFGRRYYLSSENSRWSYRLSNYLIQGTCADLLKECIFKIDHFLQKREAKSRMILTVHDEIQIEVWKGEEWLIPKIKEIMENHPWHLIPIVCDVERTNTTWADKEGVSLEDLSIRSVGELQRR